MAYGRGLVAAIGVVTLAGSALGQEASEEPEEPGVEIRSLYPDSSFEYDLEGEVAVARDGVVVTYQDAFLRADTVRLNRRERTIDAEGEVYLQQGDKIWTAEELQYNYRTGAIESGPFRAGRPPVFIEGDSVSTDFEEEGGDPVYTAKGASVTTDDVEDPAFRVGAGKLTIAPEDYLIARNAVIYLGDVPVFYLPYYRRNLRRAGPRFELTPGYRSEHGGFLLGTYYWEWSDQLDGAVHLDYRDRRGFGLGPDLEYELESVQEELGSGELRYYYLNDQKPGRDPFTDERIRDDRYRFRLAHRSTLRTNLTGKLMIRKQSDPFVTRDFLESEFRQNTQPDSSLELNQQWPNFSLNLLSRPRFNDFFERVERLPDIKLTGHRQQIGASPLYYEGESSLGYFRRRFAETNATPDFAAFRGDTFHQVLLPKTFFGWLNVTPRIGGRFTHYGEAHDEGGTTPERNRGVFNTGAEVSFKASRVWPEVQNDLFEIRELRHIVEPSVNYAYLPNPNVRPGELPQFETSLPSFELPSLHFPDINAIDSIDGQNVFRWGLQNKLQTKRRSGIADVIDWGIFTDWRVDRHRGEETFSDIFSNLKVRPRSWLTLHSQLRYDITDTRFRLAQHGATIRPGSKWSLSLAHRFVRTGPLFGLGNNLIMSRFYYKFNENWGARIEHRFEARDGRLEEQSYSLYRDLRSWTAALTFRVRQGRREPTDYSVAATVSLKAFPRFGLGDDRNEPERLLGR